MVGWVLHRNCGTSLKRYNPVVLSPKERRAAGAIEDAVAREKWSLASRLIRERLKRSPTDHWLLSRLALTYYEQRQYRRALRYDLKALQDGPYCPLAIWGYASTLDMLKQPTEALKLYRWLISWGEDELAYGPCGEGIRSARSLIADCYYRIAAIQGRGWPAKASYRVLQRTPQPTKEGNGQHLRTQRCPAKASVT
jgi:tetratricopeptide (TPR) repeat protein